MNTFHDERFVFETDFEFAARSGKNEYFAGEGDLITVRPGNHMWETNFVPDLAAIELKSWGDRGGGGTNIMFVLADGTMHAHISEMPVGTYKKGHRHGPGFHVMCVTGHGYSLLWYDDQQDFQRLDWHYGVVFPPADQQFHQHFNASQHPARYLATGVGGLRYPLTLQQRRSLLGVKPGEKGAVSLSHEGGRRPDRIRGPGQAHPPDLARRDAQERRDAADGEGVPGGRGEGDGGGGVGGRFAVRTKSSSPNVLRACSVRRSNHLRGHSGAAHAALGRPDGGTRNPDGLACCTAAWIPGSREDARPGMTMLRRSS